VKPIVDGDIVAYRAAASAENESLDVCLWRVDDTIRLIKEAAKNFIESSLYLSGSGNFRKTIDPEYKLNRKDKTKPKWLQAARDHMVSKYGAEIVDGMEADDALGINQTDNTLLCTIDKDLLMIPGHHYNWVKEEFREVSLIDGVRHFYKQMLIGDPTDNVVGVRGLGPVKAGKMLDPVTDPYLMYEIVRDTYCNNIRFLKNANLLWIMRKPNEMWQDAHPELYKELKQDDNSTEEEADVEDSEGQDQVQVPV
jgi:5'-3' exonuclease